MTTNDAVQQQRNGIVVLYNPEKAFGFVREFGDHGTEQFFHVSSVDGRLALRAGDVVSFFVVPSDRKPGTTQAVGIRLRKRDEITIGDAQ